MSGEHHRNVQGGPVRAAVFGVSDGLVTNVSLILGVAGARAAAGNVRLAGFAGLLAGAFSMAAGEFISMSPQAELTQREVTREREAIQASPEEERQELADLYQSRGVRSQVAGEVATELMADPDVALEIHTREELGVDSTALGSPLGAALSSFVSFAVGAAVPLAPWFVASGTTAVVVSLIAAALAALAIGAVLGGLAGRSLPRSAARQLIVAMVAAGATFLIGRLVGVSVS